VAKNNGKDAGADENPAPEEVAAEGRPLSIFEQARNADLRHEAERARMQEIAEEDKQRLVGGERKAGNETTEHVATPFSMRTHPDGTPKRMVICRPNGTSEREVTVEEWDRIQANPNLPVGSWIIKYTELVAPHHSDQF
jgi:hypothetical protein